MLYINFEVLVEYWSIKSGCPTITIGSVPGFIYIYCFHLNPSSK
jgi:hypothetical protein